MKFLLPIGMLLGVLALTCPHLFAAGQQSAFGDPASLGLFGMGLVALGIARKHHKGSDT